MNVYVAHHPGHGDYFGAAVALDCSCTADCACALCVWRTCAQDTRAKGPCNTHCVQWVHCRLNSTRPSRHISHSSTEN